MKITIIGVEQRDAQASEAQLFDGILCGVDGAAASPVAVQQALRLQNEHRTVLRFVVANMSATTLVGSRGLEGLEALGSVSERVARQARSSVLVVRPGQT